MRKRRLLYYIFSLITSIIVLCLSIIYGYYLVAASIIFLLMIPNFYLRKKEKKLAGQIIESYSMNCDPIAYINATRQYAKKCVLTKKQKLIYELYYAIAYLDAGNFEMARKALLILDENERYLDEVTMVLYLKAWSDYFYYNLYDEKMKDTLYKLKDIVVKTRNAIARTNYLILYTTQQSKYYILTGQHLPQARQMLESKMKVLPGLLARISTMYQLALMDLKEKKYEHGIAKLKEIAETNKDLFIVKNSQKMLENHQNLKVCI